MVRVVLCLMAAALLLLWSLCDWPKLEVRHGYSGAADCTNSDLSGVCCTLYVREGDTSYHGHQVSSCINSTVEAVTHTAVVLCQSCYGGRHATAACVLRDQVKQDFYTHISTLVAMALAAHCCQGWQQMQLRPTILPSSLSTVLALLCFLQLCVPCVLHEHAAADQLS